MPAARLTPTEQDAGALLRARGLRVTPQRRAIMSAFAGGATEHLSADEVHARASSTVPELSRGTVYSTLAELTELGLLGALGSPEPVRYEINATDHDHFRCRLCLRLHDVELPTARVDRLTAKGFVVDRTSITVEGVCADCVRYDAGLREGVRKSVSASAEPATLPAGLACSEIDSPLGTLLLAATSRGLIRLIYGDHVDAPLLREHLRRRRRGTQAARGHLDAALALVRAYFAGDAVPPSSCVVDWEAFEGLSVPTLQAVQTIGPGLTRSYDLLRSEADAHERGLTLGANPLAIVVPCHRVTRGSEITDAYVGGLERKQYLRQHEQR
jgi:Fe2+ or Zn2+ uptake regulation protein/O6-methylguanine-DNA--protein-cysteine methyltransferase